VAELPGARLVEMTLKADEEDVPHDHPSHSMYFIKGGKLQITDYESNGKSKENPHAVEIPSGACPIFPAGAHQVNNIMARPRRSCSSSPRVNPIFPAGAHQVKNVGTTEVKVLFVEPYLVCAPCGEGGVLPGDWATPFAVAPECCTILAENDDWITAELTMAPGVADPLHYHKDHLMYVLEGDELTIFPNGEGDGMKVPLYSGKAVSAPMTAPPFFKHIVKNSGSVPLKMIFFEMKK